MRRAHTTSLTFYQVKYCVVCGPFVSWPCPTMRQIEAIKNPTEPETVNPGYPDENQIRNDGRAEGATAETATAER